MPRLFIIAIMIFSVSFLQGKEGHDIFYFYPELGKYGLRYFDFYNEVSDRLMGRMILEAGLSQNDTFIHDISFTKNHIEIRLRNGNGIILNFTYARMDTMDLYMTASNLLELDSRTNDLTGRYGSGISSNQNTLIWRLRASLVSVQTGVSNGFLIREKALREPY